MRKGRAIYEKHPVAPCAEGEGAERKGKRRGCPARSQAWNRGTIEREGWGRGGKGVFEGPFGTRER